MKAQIGIGISPLTGKVYIGNQDKEKGMWVGEKRDITDEFIDVMSEYLKLNTCSKYRIGDKHEYFIHLSGDKEKLAMAINYLQAQIDALTGEELTITDNK